MLELVRRLQAALPQVRDWIFSVFKGGVSGVYQHCNCAHLHRYLSEFDFRAVKALKTHVSRCIRLSGQSLPSRSRLLRPHGSF